MFLSLAFRVLVHQVSNATVQEGYLWDRRFSNGRGTGRNNPLGLQSQSYCKVSFAMHLAQDIVHRFAMRLAQDIVHRVARTMVIEIVFPGETHRAHVRKRKKKKTSASNVI